MTNVSLAGWTVVCLRPRADQGAAGRAVAARGGTALALPGLRLVAMRDGAAAREALQAALACEATVFTSPAAVRFAARLARLPPRAAFAIGAGSAAALRRHGVVALQPDADAMHAEGLLALPALASAARVGLVTAPGGRDVIAPALQARAKAVVLAHVYRRRPPRWRDDEIAALEASASPRAVLVSSAEALAHVLAQLPASARTRLLDAHAIASSERLHAIAREAGFARVSRAASPMLDAMLDAIPVTPR